MDPKPVPTRTVKHAHPLELQKDKAHLSAFLANDARSPFSLFNELFQKGLLQDLRYEDCGLDVNGWNACVTLAGDWIPANSLSSEACGSSKGDAKRQASKVLLEELRQIVLSPDPAEEKELAVKPGEGQHLAPFCLPVTQESLINVRPALIEQRKSTEYTRKQLNVLEIAQRQLDILHDVQAATHREPLWSSKFLAIDVEWHEFNRHVILEVGLAWAPLKPLPISEADICSHHLVVSDYYAVRNGTYVPDNKDNFNFGESEQVSLMELSKRLRSIISETRCGAEHVYLVGHSVHADIAVIQELGLSDLMADRVTVCDLAQAYQAMYKHKHLTSLSKILESYNISYMSLHNAGNDAFYTLTLYLKMLSS